MKTRFAAREPRSLRSLIVIASALLGAVLPVAAAPAASARTAPAASSIVRTAPDNAVNAVPNTVPNAAPIPRSLTGPCARATLLAVQKRQLLKNADHFAGAMDAVLRNPPHHRCAALVDYLRQTSA